MIRQPLLIRIVYRSPVFLLGFLGYAYAIQLVFNYREDTTNTTNAAFAIMASLSALSFSFARAIEPLELRNRLTFAGERLLHGAVLVLVASLLKYFVFVFLSLPSIPAVEYAETIGLFTLGLLVAVIFSNGVLFAHTGLPILNDLLLNRMTREKDWDDLW